MNENSKKNSLVPSRIGLIGYGAISQEILGSLAARGSLESVCGVLVRPPKKEQLRSANALGIPFLDSIEELLDRRPEIVIEAAGHAAVKTWCATILGAGCDVLVASVGALADHELASQILSDRHSNEVWFSAGAVAGLDGLLAANSAGLRNVSYTSLKPHIAWRGTPAEELLNHMPLAPRTIFYEGSAREAAILFPQNANVGVAIALAGLGLEETRVLLGAGSDVNGPLGIIDADGDFGTFHFEIVAFPSPLNPKSSRIVGHSLVSSLLDDTRISATRRLRAFSSNA